MKITRITTSAALLLFAATLSAQTVRESVSLSVNHEDGLYEIGDTLRVWADVKSVPDKEVYFHIITGCDFGNAVKTPITLNRGKYLVFEKVVSEAQHYIFEITDGVKPKNFKDPAALGNAFAGALVDPYGYEVGFDEPSDLFDFWNREIKKMRSMKMKTDITRDNTENGIRTYHVDINCVGPAPCRAYVSYPENAKEHSLPVILYLHFAGSPGTPSSAAVSASYAQLPDGGALAMDLNAHGMLDDMPAEYYKELSKGELNGYAKREPSDKRDYYFKWMMLRAVRALDYLCSNPLWDGRHVIVTGASQGGYQSAFLAGIDSRVTSAIMTVPAGLDQGAGLKGRKPSWPYTFYDYPESTIANSPYFDPAVFLKYTKAEIWCEIGLYDITCPAANLFAVLNTVPTKKTIITYQRPHSVQLGLKEQHAPIEELRNQAFRDAAVR